jgi:cytochrome oxidase assembly protein ShyY1
MLVSSEQQARRLGVPVLGGHVVQTAPEPRGETPEPIGEPGRENAALNYAYAVQWWLFAAGVPVGWFVLVRRERRDRAEAAAAGKKGAGDETEDSEPAVV